MYAQPDIKLIEAGRQYRSGNYEKSLVTLQGFMLPNEDQYIQKEILTVENYIALHFSEDTIRNALLSIYKVNPNFDLQSVNMDISDALTQRLKTIVVYPKLVGSMDLDLLFTFPLVQKVPGVCEECIVHDQYRYGSFNTGIGFRLAYMISKSWGGEIGLGINSAGYRRNIEGSYDTNYYKVEFTEKLLFLNVPVRIIKSNSVWTYKAGINYRYLLSSDASAILKNTTRYNENEQLSYTLDNSVNYRNRNLVFLSLEINRILLDLTNKTWFVTAGAEFQMGLNSLT